MAATRRDCIARCPLDTETVAKCACARHPPDPTGAGGCVRIPFNGIHPQGRRPTLRLVPSRRRPGGRRVTHSHGTSPGSAGRWPASPGSRAWRRGMRAGRPRSRRGPTLRLVPSRRRPGGRRVTHSHGTSPGSAGRWPASPGSRAWRRGMRAGRPRSRRGPTLRLVPSRRRPGGRRVRYSHGTSPGSAGRWPASPGSRAWRRGMRAGRPRSRRGPTLRLVPSRRRPGGRRVTHSHGTSPGSAGRWPASPGSRAWRRARGDLALDALRLRRGVRGSWRSGRSRPRSPLTPGARAVVRTCGASLGPFGGSRDRDRSPRGRDPVLRGSVRSTRARRPKGDRPNRKKTRPRRSASGDPLQIDRLTPGAATVMLPGVTTLRRACRPHVGGRPYGHHRWP